MTSSARMMTSIDFFEAFTEPRPSTRGPDTAAQQGDVYEVRQHQGTLRSGKP